MTTAAVTFIGIPVSGDDLDHGLLSDPEDISFLEVVHGSATEDVVEGLYRYSGYINGLTVEEVGEGRADYGRGQRVLGRVVARVSGAGNTHGEDTTHDEINAIWAAVVRQVEILNMNPDEVKLYTWLET